MKNLLSYDLSQKKLKIWIIITFMALFVILFGQLKVLPPIGKFELPKFNKPVEVMAASTPESEKKLNKTGDIDAKKSNKEIQEKRDKTSKAAQDKKLKQKGDLKKGQKLPALELEITPVAFNWLIERNQAVILVKMDKRIFKVIPDPYQGFDKARFNTYSAKDAVNLSTRNINIAGSKWVSTSSLTRQLKLKGIVGSKIDYEFRLSNNLDSRLISLQVESLKKKGITPKIPDFHRVSIAVIIDIFDNKLRIKVANSVIGDQKK